MKLKGAARVQSTRRTVTRSGKGKVTVRPGEATKGALAVPVKR